MKRFSFFLVLLTLSCSKREVKLKDPSLKLLHINGVELYVNLSTSPAEWEKGLTFTESLPDTEGMLFVFPESRNLSFWMKNTSIDLSIAFLDSNGVIIEIYDLKPYDETPIVSKHPVKYALEVNKGWFERNNVTLFDTAQFPWEITK
ncbi:MAG TPA: DUF192 domain-containing protein [Candidatus Hydrothermia bacterium]|nr:DUF192 domain-containing protein [Candidatus Hydrothermae bacterium]MDD3648895.1 DUF192 domain-containing protein [Candidatus Hydrothermia bacterium]MDD5572621.1 DUF192 domain-containing protein [Candidatus Hydrothermia bacterium]HOK23136.1 DUF192 domain-containing protein [Candidatus Hydrothermia bacterium]HOL23840.1 DUF192 domain-containing protein [Candidatus Hydrothermia bacterium]